MKSVGIFPNPKLSVRVDLGMEKSFANCVLVVFLTGDMDISSGISHSFRRLTQSQNRQS